MRSHTCCSCLADHKLSGDSTSPGTCKTLTEGLRMDSHTHTDTPTVRGTWSTSSRNVVLWPRSLLVLLLYPPHPPSTEPPQPSPTSPPFMIVSHKDSHPHPSRQPYSQPTSA
ncbi:hypothetical protein ElyMa_001771600 [Elysia marginata]|uniref:Uncharacterized protein n=1 Tax=Elysia marginata TaxID=1093978 RepID=A0AAV4EC74_9GAST|nr:hypothetical protein ElyMa_001771600 [Elysia marginata]